MFDSDLFPEHANEIKSLIKARVSYERLQDRIQEMAHEQYPLCYKGLCHGERNEYKYKLRCIYGDLEPKQFTEFYYSKKDAQIYKDELERLRGRIIRLELKLEIMETKP